MRGIARSRRFTRADAARAAGLAWLLVLVALVPCATASAKTCADYRTQAAAQAAGDTLDGDGDGVYCERLPCPCSSAPPGGSAPLPFTSAPATEQGTRQAARIVSVTDGDTLKVRLRDGRRRRVRLIGIDTPETVKPGVSVECGGRSATSEMRRLAMHRRRGRLVGHEAVLIGDGSQGGTDRFGRTLAYVEVGGRDVGRQLVSLGWAAVFVYATPFARLDAYRAASDVARASAAGVWGRCGGNFHSAQR